MVLWNLQILRKKWRHCTQNNRISAQSTSEAYSDSWYLHYSSSIHSDWLTDWLKLLGCGMSVRDTWATTRVGDVPLPMHPTTLTPWLTDWSFLTVVGVSKTFAQFPCWVQMIQNIRVTKSLQIYPVLRTKPAEVWTCVYPVHRSNTSTVKRRTVSQMILCCAKRNVFTA